MSSAPSTDVLTPSRGELLELKLVVFEGPDRGAEHVLGKGTHRIGTDPSNEWVLKDTAISRTHLIVEVLGDKVRLVDNQSTNGSFCAGMRFSTLEVKAGASIRIGRTEMALLPASFAPGAVSERERFGGLLGKSLAMRKTFALLERIAGTDADVLVHGETGTGKEVCAEAIHAQSARAKGPLVVCDLSAIAANLIESELFGHVRGAFTGASSDRAGVFEQADQGTLFLDEVGELPLELQPRLLRAIERRQVKRVGANDYQTVDVRIVAATHRELREHVSAGKFREDLYHRLAVVTVTLPPLRERPEDIPLLVDAFLAKMEKPPSALSAETRALLSRHDWRGNVRELRNVVERAVSLGDDAALPGVGSASPRAGSKGGSAVSADKPFKEAKDALVEAFERDYLADLLSRAEGNVSRAARAAGIDRVHLHRLLRKHGLSAK